MSRKRKPCDVRRAERRKMERNVAFSKRLAYELDCRFYFIEPEGGYLAMSGSDDFDPKAEVPVVPFHIIQRWKRIEEMMNNNIINNNAKLNIVNSGKSSTEVFKIEDPGLFDHVEDSNVTYRADAPQWKACATDILVPKSTEQQEHVVFKHRPPERKAHAIDIALRAVFKHRPPERKAHAINISVLNTVEEQGRAVFKHRPPEELLSDLFLFGRTVRYNLRTVYHATSVIGAADTAYEYSDITIVSWFPHFNMGFFFDDPDFIQCVNASTLINSECILKYIYGSTILLWLQICIYGLATVVALSMTRIAVMIMRSSPGKFRRIVVQGLENSRNQMIDCALNVEHQAMESFVSGMPNIRVTQHPYTELARVGILIPPCNH